MVFGGLNSIKSHIQTAHCEVFHKCPSCPMAFKSSPSAQSHISSQHPALTGGQAKYLQTLWEDPPPLSWNSHHEGRLSLSFRMIYKCVMCDTVFTQKPLLYMHFDTHLAKQKVHVFKCPDCTKLYAQKGSMMEHIKVRVPPRLCPAAFRCCPFIAPLDERGVSKGKHQVLGVGL